MFSNDDQRIFDMVVYSTMMVAGPITTVYATFYMWWLLGPMSLIGIIAFVFFYPAQVRAIDIIYRCDAGNQRY